MADNPKVVIVKPGEVIDRTTGNVAQFRSMPISPTEKIEPSDQRWNAAVKQQCGTESHRFIQQPDGTYKPEVP